MAFVVTCAGGQKITVYPPGTAPPQPAEPVEAKTIPASHSVALTDAKSQPTPSVHTIIPSDSKTATTVTVYQPAVQVNTAAAANVFKCPRCKEWFIVNAGEMNCRIFRHAAYRQLQDISLIKNPSKEKCAEIAALNALVDPARAGELVAPHLPRNECEKLVASGHAVGCCAPLEIVGDTAVECDYK